MMTMTTMHAPAATTRAVAMRRTVRARTMMMTKRGAIVAVKASGRGDEDAAPKRSLNGGLAAFMAATIMLTGAIDADVAEAARSGGRVGGGSFRASSRSAPRMSAQSRGAPPVGGYARGGYGYNSVFMPMPIMPMYGFGFGFGGLGFIFNIMFFLFVVNFVLSFLQSFQQSNDPRDRRDDDEF
jgi:uncharacterized membrane protein